VAARLVGFLKKQLLFNECLFNPSLTKPNNFVIMNTAIAMCIHSEFRNIKLKAINNHVLQILCNPPISRSAVPSDDYHQGILTLFAVALIGFQKLAGG
jgi:hypothetical protein